MTFKQKLQLRVQAEIKTAEPMAHHTTWQVGGPADYLVCPQNEDELSAVIETCNEYKMPFYVIGRGSNLLVLDAGIRGLVIKMAGPFSYVKRTPFGLCAGSGTPVTELCRAALKLSLSGLEFLNGIPGSLGGAAIMNAGAFGHYIGELIINVSLVDYEGGHLSLNKPELTFGYRSSNLAGAGIITAVSLELEEKEQEKIKEAMEANLNERLRRHPKLPSCGSVFRNLPGRPAGRLIEEAGGKGLRVGGAEVSGQHANFIVNRGTATAADILAVIKKVQALVEEVHGLKLYPEVKIIGRER